jgi:hypothetical protein
MEYTAISDQLKYINANGITLNLDERMNLNLSLQKLQLDFGFEELLFWGKVNGKHRLQILMLIQVSSMITMWLLA